MFAKWGMQGESSGTYEEEYTMDEQTQDRGYDGDEGEPHAEQGVEVAIVGGGSAGLSAALTLARARRSVVVIDAGQPRNAPAAAVHGLLGLEGVNPMELLVKGRSDAAQYGARIVQATVTAARGEPDGGFTLDLGDGSRVRADQVLIATGVRDELPEVPGLAQRWGRDVVHCPYCHGWEIRGKRIGLLAAGPMSVMQAMLFSQWTEHISFFPNGSDFSAEHYESLAALGIIVVPGQIESLVVEDDRLTAVRMVDGVEHPLDALAVPAVSRARIDGLEGLGVQCQSSPMGVTVVADPTGHTSASGVWAAGNVVNAWMQVSESAANGARVAMTLNNELVLGKAVSPVAEASPTVPVAASR